MPVYLDHHATTPPDPRVIDAMLPFLTHRFGNAGSVEHRFGWDAERAVEAARVRVARLVGADAVDVVLTSGATEANNLALLGFPLAAGDHVVSTVLEHASIVGCLTELARRGVCVTRVPAVNGRVQPAALAAALRPQTRLVSITAANHELGTLQPIGAIGALLRGREVVLHVDAAQAAGRVPLDMRAMNVGMLTLSAHKMHGPMGIGALAACKAVRDMLRPLAFGGGQEGGLRPGTVPVAAAVGLGVACDLARLDIRHDRIRLLRLRRRLLRELRAIPGLRVHGAGARRLPGSLNIGWPGLVVTELLYALRDAVATSSGSACASAAALPSPALLSLGLNEAEALGGLRLALGRFTSEAEIDAAVTALVQAASRSAAPARVISVMPALRATSSASRVGAAIATSPPMPATAAFCAIS